MKTELDIRERCGTGAFRKTMLQYHAAHLAGGALPMAHESEGRGSVAEEIGTLKDLRKDCAATMRRMLDQSEKDGRDLHADEQKAFDALADAVEYQTHRIDRLESDPTSVYPTEEQAHAAAAYCDATGLPYGRDRSARRPQASEWTDAHGNAITLLGARDSFADAVARKTGQHPARLPSNSLARTIQGMVTGDHSGMEQAVQAGGFNASLLTGSDPDGGYFVNPSLAGTMIDHARARSTAIQAGVRTMPMESPEVRMVRVDDDPEFAFTGEGQEISESAPPFGMVRLVAKKLAVQIPISSELLEDAVGLQAELDRLLGESIAASIDSSIYNGDGKKGSFTGILHAAHVQEHAATAPKSLNWDDLLESQYLLDVANLGTDPRLVLPPAMAKQIRGAKDSDSRYIVPPASMSDLTPMVSTNLPATSGVFGRFVEGILGIRSQLSIMVNPYTLAKRDMYLITARWRGDFALTRPKGIVKLTGFDGSA
ncbi:phage major capsid protein [Wenzhouxiangella sediminis]|uniref:Phage major capsid protein n=1 Tax=Wenzhouxiangella sediminis TaxID=1792836 RepID=A0A3E1K5B0_9GAMM|nr:phage major capsid protein [Wenzhouxiangella sediminis]RFF29222.1 phage major capsid protein [Wenzhouxiangella sediminis]